MGIRALKAVLVVALALTWCGSAVAAPPSEPPGKSGSAPGHQKDAPAPEPPQAPAVEPVVPVVPVEPASAPAVEEAKAKPDHGRPAGKPERGGSKQPQPEPVDHADAPPAPKHAAPTTPAAVPPASISAPGASGPHKVTICHNGHAITVDAHAARTHVERHGDTYAPAGAKGRRACATPVRDNEPERPVEREVTTSVDVVTKATEMPLRPATAAAAAAAADPAVPARVEVAQPARPPKRQALRGEHAVLATTQTTLPFTGRSLPAIVLAALGLIALGTFLRRSQLSRP